MLPQEEVNYLGKDLPVPEFQMRVACQSAEGSDARREQPFGSEARAGSVHDERRVRENLRARCERERARRRNGLSDGQLGGTDSWEALCMY